MRNEDMPKPMQSLEMIKPVVRYVASAKPLAFIHSGPPQPCGRLHKKETTAIRCALRHNLAYVVAFVTWEKRRPGWLAWKNMKVEEICK